MAPAVLVERSGWGMRENLSGSFRLYCDQSTGLAGEPGRQVGDILGRQRGNHALHDEILACASLIIRQRLAQIVFVLASQTRVERKGTVPVGAMARDAGRAFGFTGGSVAANGLGLSGGLETGDVSRDVVSVLFTERKGVGVHGRMLAPVGLIVLQRCGHILGMLATQPGDRVGRIGVGVAGDSMATGAGSEFNLASDGVASRQGGLGQNGAYDQGHA